MASDVGRGSVKTLNAQFYAYAGGPAADPSSVSLKILKGATTVLGPLTYAEGHIDRTGTGSYTYDYNVPEDAEVGVYTAQWTATINGATNQGSEDFEVIAAGEVAAGRVSLLVSVDDAQDITGRMLSSEDLRQAQFIIELAVNRDLATDTISPRNLRWLKRAISYQAAWMEEHTEVFSAQDIASLSQVDLSINFRDSRDSLYLAPLARKAIMRLSWMRSRSVSLNSAFQDDRPAISDDDLVWESL